MRNLLQFEHIEQIFPKKSINSYITRLDGMSMLSTDEWDHINRIRQNKNRTSRIHGIYSIIRDNDFKIDENSIIIENKKIVLNLCEDCLTGIQSVLLFLITIQTDYEEKEMSVMDQYYSNILNNAALHMVRDEIVTRFSIQVIKNDTMGLSVIYGPGYYNMELSQNIMISDLLQAHKIGVSINKQYQFSPEDTLCGVVFQYKNENAVVQKYGENSCEYCKAISKHCGFCSFR